MQTITMKGYEAHKAGLPTSACPYEDGYHNQNGNGGQLQRVRAKHWHEGWHLHEREEKGE